MTNGLGQGDPLSPLMFAVATLPLSEAINRSCTAYSGDRRKMGLPPPNECFADDAVACIDYSPENIRKYLEVFEEFGRVANLTIAKDKSTIALSKELGVEEYDLLRKMGFSRENIIGKGVDLSCWDRKYIWNWIRTTLSFWRGS